MPSYSCQAANFELELMDKGKLRARTRGQVLRISFSVPTPGCFIKPDTSYLKSSSLQKAFNQDISPPRPIAGASFQFNLLNLKRAKPVFLPLLLSF